MQDVLLILVQCKFKGTLEFVEDGQAFQEVLSWSLNCIMIVCTSWASSYESQVSRAIF